MCNLLCGCLALDETALSSRFSPASLVSSLPTFPNLSVDILPRSVLGPPLTQVASSNLQWHIFSLILSPRLENQISNCFVLIASSTLHLTCLRPIPSPLSPLALFIFLCFYFRKGHPEMRHLCLGLETSESAQTSLAKLGVSKSSEMSPFSFQASLFHFPFPRYRPQSFPVSVASDLSPF